MGQFLSDLPLLELQSSGRIWKLFSDVIYQCSDGEIIVAPREFLTDLTSVPRILRSLIRKEGKWTPGSIIHDYLYKTQGRKRKRCDKIFRETMISLDVNKWRRRMIYRGVRFGGWVAWRRNKIRLR